MRGFPYNPRGNERARSPRRRADQDPLRRDQQDRVVGLARPRRRLVSRLAQVAGGARRGRRRAGGRKRRRRRARLDQGPLRPSDPLQGRVRRHPGRRQGDWRARGGRLPEGLVRGARGEPREATRAHRHGGRRDHGAARRRLLRRRRGDGRQRVALGQQGLAARQAAAALGCRRLRTADAGAERRDAQLRAARPRRSGSVHQRGVDAGFAVGPRPAPRRL